MKLFRKKKLQATSNESIAVAQIAERESGHPFHRLNQYVPLGTQKYELYTSLREGVPIIDAALDKIVRLIGDFSVVCDDETVGSQLNSFMADVRSNGCNTGIKSFLSVYLNQLLTYGTSVGEVILTGDGRSIYSLYNAPLKDLELVRADNNVDTLVCYSNGITREVLPYQNLLLVSTLNPEPGKITGTSLLKSLPFVSDVLLKIYGALGENWDRVGNVRFAVTYKPTRETDGVTTRKRAEQVAAEWGKAMHSKSNAVSDFVTVGDVDIKVIGADNQILDSEIPVREMLEQIVAKLSVPPFLLGLSWSTSERMSQQQADILTSELEYYRSILSGVVRKICDMWLRLNGVSVRYSVEWENINLQDELELAQARLYNAQAQQLEENMAVVEQVS